MNSNKRVVLLVDADNVSADVVEQAVAAVLGQHGAIHVRRAYCTAESALKNLAVFKRLAIRPMVNLSAGKNSTDIALAVDAVDLVVAERPEVVVIVSSDSDFAPLVIRLREKGCRVEGIGQQGKTGDETIAVYDAYTVIAHRKGGKGERADKGERTDKGDKGERGERSDKGEKGDKDGRPSAPARAAKTPKAARAPRAPRSSRAAPRPAPPPALPEDVERILMAVPALREGAKLDLRIAAEPLRAAGLLSNSAPSTKLFRKHAEFFAVTPEKNPNKVQYLGSAR
jgi:uncharacterized protein (TIGR00288 family)